MNSKVLQNFIHSVENRSNSFSQSLGYKKPFSIKEKLYMTSQDHTSMFSFLFSFLNDLVEHIVLFPDKMLGRNMPNIHTKQV